MWKEAMGVVAVALLACACNKETSAAPAPTKAENPGTVAAKTETPKPSGGADVPCSKVVEKFMSFDPKAGEPEKKLWTAMCEKDMTPEARACLVASKSSQEGDECFKKFMPKK